MTITWSEREVGGVEFRVLGKLEVLVDSTPIDLGTYRQRALLALLLTTPGEVVSSDRIIDGLWGADSGGDKQNALWVHLSGLRTALEPQRAKRSQGSVILTQSPGYVAQVDPNRLDTLVFERLVNQGKSLVEVDPSRAATTLREALGLWRGRAFEEFAYEQFAQGAAAHLDSLRREALEARIDADLREGRASELVPELESLVRDQPLHEGFTGHLMVALYRAGRQVESLRAYQMLRTRLGEELGLEPSPLLRRIEEQIVTGDESVGAPVVGAKGTVGNGLTVRGYELREELGRGASGLVYRAYQPSVGREVAIKVLHPELADNPDFIRRFEAEARVVASLEQPHVVPLYDFWREPGAAYLVMRLLRGGSLQSRLDAHEMGPEATVRIARQVGAALAAAHRSGVVHRDVKPENILLDDDDNAYLSDFGIAISTSEPKDGYASGRSPYSTFADAAGSATAESDTYSLAVVLARSLASSQDRRAGTPSLPAAQAAIERATAADPDLRYTNVEEFVAAFCEPFDQPRSRPASAASSAQHMVNPYKGLRPFGGADALDFFGRERLIERLVARLGDAGRKGRFVAVVGPSGSGKSSLVRAGVLPALADGAVVGSQDWFKTMLTPGMHPFEELEDALRRVAVDPPASLLEQLTTDTSGLRRSVETLLPDDGSQLLVVIDQFEELFTQVDEATAASFADALVDAVLHEHSRVRVLVTLRADFYDRPLSHRRLGELMHWGTEVVAPMSTEELERAITGPAARAGVQIDTALVAELVRDVSNRTGALPLLQYALTELFELRSGSRIHYGSYAEIGGVPGALSRRAESLYAGLGPDAAEVARQVFLRLVTLGDGSDDTRRRVQRRDLEHLSVERRHLDAVLDVFGRHRLLTFDRDPISRGPTVEISHEALLREWSRLRTWVDEARDDLRQQRRLGAAATEWINAKRRDEYLLGGGLLSELEAWAATTSHPLSVPEQAFLDASLAEKARAAAEVHAREQRVHTAESKAASGRRQLLGVGGVALVVAALAVFGLVQWRSATAARDDVAIERDQAEAARAASASLVAAEAFRAASAVELDRDPELSLLLAVEAVRATAELGYATEDAIDGVHWALQQLGVEYPVGPEAAVTRRSGPTGLTGVFVLSPAELVDLAEGSTSRVLSEQECLAAGGQGCSDRTAIDPDLPLRNGVENYTVSIPEVLPGVPAFGDGPLGGTRVTLAYSSTTAVNEALERELRAFTNRTGIRVELLPNIDFDLTAQLGTGEIDAVPDIVGFTSQDWFGDRAVDLSNYLLIDTLRADFGDYLVDLGTTDGPNGPELHAVPLNLVPKGLVFYPKNAFAEAGYEVPETFAQLVDLSSQMVADGRTPWCHQWWSGFASGWPGTDLLESLTLRVGGTGVYDSWVDGTLNFASPEVLEAARLAEELLFTDGFVRGGTASISKQDWPLVLLNLLDPHPSSNAAGPQCWFVHHAASMISLTGPGGGAGDEIGFFMLPPVVTGDGPATTGSGSMATALADRPEIRELMSFIASPRWGEVWAGVDAAGGGDTFFSVNRRFDTTAYSGVPGPDTQRAQPRTDEDYAIRLAIHEAQMAALERETWRMDASDMMANRFGFWTEDLQPGPFLQAMLDWVDQEHPVERIFADLDAQRSANR